MVLISVENLTAVEEQLGPNAAQQIIQSLASLIDKHVGVMGISARYGRQEILSVLPSTDQRRAERLLEEMARELQGQEILKHKDCPMGFSIRAGLAQGGPGTELSELVEQAKSQQIYLAEVACTQKH